MSCFVSLKLILLFCIDCSYIVNLIAYNHTSMNIVTLILLPLRIIICCFNPKLAIAYRIESQK